MTTPKTLRRHARITIASVFALIALGSCSKSSNTPNLTGPAPVASVGVSPASATITAGSSATLTATPEDSRNNPLTGRAVTWSSDNTAVAMVDGNGLVTAVAAGTAHITATCEGKSASATITVSVVPVASVTVTPASANVAQGGQQQLTATPKDASSNPLTGRVVTWSSDNTAVATVNSSGRVSGVAVGSATMTATCETKTGTSTITVIVVPVASVTVTPASPSIQAGSSVQLTATPRDASNNPLTGRTVTWSSGNAAVATVNGSGLVTGVTAGGPVTITATCETKTGTSAVTVTAANPGGSLPAQFFPPDNIWNTDISTLPVHPMSATWMATVGTSKNLHVGFYPDQWGMRYNIVDASTPMIMVRIVNQDPSDSDLIPYPFTAQTLIQLGTPDSEAFMIDPGQHYLYEMYNAHWNSGDPYASATVRWDLTSNALRTDNHSSADEAGLPIFQGLFRWDEVQKGVINHAFRFENGWGHIDGTAGAHLWPARHDGFESPPNSNAPPMGARLRLKASYDISGFSPNARVILTAMKKYGMLLADHGDDWELVGTADSGWPISLIDELGTVPASAFDFVDESGLMVDPNSAQALQPSAARSSR